MNKMISASIMCANPLSMNEELGFLSEKGIGYFHCDIMDGHFVPNITLSPDTINAVKSAYTIPLDIHLMVDDPCEVMEWLDFGEGDYVSVHAESTHHLNRALDMVRKRGAKAMVALNPATPLYCLQEVIEDIDGVLIMTVNPGFAGQKLVQNGPSRVSRARAMLSDLGRKDMLIEVDGNCSLENIPKLKNAGADLFVLGTSSLFDRKHGIEYGYERSLEVL